MSSLSMAAPDAAHLSRLSPSKRRLLELMLEERRREKRERRGDTIPRRTHAGPPPLSFAQQRLWFLDQLDPGNPAFNIPAAVRLEGDLDVAALVRGLTEIARRHETLRTTFRAGADGEPVQVIAPESEAGIEVPVVDFRPVPAALHGELVRRFATWDAQRPFELARGPLWRFTLLRLGSKEHVAVLMMHHNVGDVWSIRVLVREVAALYAAFSQGRPSPLEELPIQYADFAVWQRRLLAGETLERQLAFWREQMAEAPAVLDVPADHPRPPVQSIRGGRVSIRLAPRLGEALKRLTRDQEVSLYMVLLAGYRTLLHRYTGETDVVVGAPVANRTRTELEGLIGFLVNSILLRLRIGDRPSFRELLGRERDVTLAAVAHQDLPFERLVEELQPERDQSRNPLYQVDFVLQNSPRARIEVAGLALEPLDIETGTAQIDLGLHLTESEEDGAVVGWLEYDSDLYEHATAERLVERFERLLEGATADPDRRLDELPLMAPEERAAVLAGAAGPALAVPAVGVHRLVAERAAAYPEALAVVAPEGGRALTYGELGRTSRRLARRLRRLGAGPGTVVGLAVERSPEMVAALLGILEAGAAYLPLDPAYPRARLSRMMADARPAVVLTRPALAAELGELAPEGVALVHLDGLLAETAEGGEDLPGPDPDELAYVIYTSGSTGGPKGVMISHRSLASYAEAARESYGIGAGDRVLQFASLSFDASAEEIYPALLGGAALVLRSDDMIDSPRRFLELSAAWKLTVADLPTAWWHELCPALAAGEAVWPVGLRLTILGGEKALGRHLEPWWRSVGPDSRLVNTYGPTEATIVATAHEVGYGLPGPDDGPPDDPPIGAAVANGRAHAVEPRLEPAPSGVTGELLLGGAGVARGYLRRPRLTAERFVPDPLSGEAGGRLYRSGDLARLDAAGRLVFAGRADSQVKLRGYRVEPEEVAEVLASHAGVARALVAARPAPGGGLRLVAWVVPSAAAKADEPAFTEALRRHLGSRLPAFMVPADLVVLDALPEGPGGKVDRGALPEPREETAGADGGVAPRTPTEELVAAIWADILGRERIGVFDNLFALGAHSLLGTQMVSRLRQSLEVELPLRSLFDDPTVAGLAAAVDRARREQEGRPAPPPMEAVPRDRPLELSFAQERLWFLEQLAPGTSAYNVPGAVRLRGPLDRAALEESFAEIVRRHEVFRTTFAVKEGRPVQVIHPPGRVPLPLLDLRGLTEEAREARSRHLAETEAQRPFDLARGPILRGLLLRLEDEEHLLILTTHHIVYDMWAREVFIRELAVLYDAFSHGRPSPLPELALQYADFAVWQRSWLSGGELDRQLAYWSEALEGIPEGLDLPTDRPRPAVQTFAGDRFYFRLPEETTEGIRALAQKQGVTPFITLLAAFDVLLHRFTHQDDVVVGTPIANRNRFELEGLIGFFANTLVLRARLADDPSFDELLKQVREASLGAYAHQDLPFEFLVEKLHPRRDLGRHPLFQVMFNFLQDYAAIEFDLSELQLELEALHNGAAQFELTVSVWEADGTFHGAADYNTDLFDESTVGRLCGSYRRILEGLLEDPRRRISELPILDEADRRQALFGDARLEEEPGAGATLHGLVEERVDAGPRRIALVATVGGATLEISYGELDRRANRLAWRLLEAGVEPEERVGVLLDRSPEMVVALFACLKAGAAYLPLDPAYPAERLAFMVADAGARTVLTRGGLGDGLPEGVRALDVGRDEGAGIDARPRAAVDPGALAYVIYTSGSTGRPKGVAISHRNAAAVVGWSREVFSDADVAGVLAATSICFDLSVFELFVPLARGGSVVLADDALALASLPAAPRVTLVNTVPSAMAELVRGGWLPPSARVVNLAGEPLRGSLARAVHESADNGVPRRVLDLYGPSEDTTYSTFAEVPPGAAEEPVIGRPVAGTAAWVLDRRLRPLPLGVPGELHLAGRGLARGYLARPALTAERFLPDPFGAEAGGRPGGRTYRTGDLVRRLADGRLDFLGRLDHQVKVRGFRIELGEVEIALAAHPGVAEAVVLARGEAPSQRLVAYLAGAAGEAPPAAELRDHLAGRLPEHMLPAVFVALDEMPRTPNGKVDRRRLPETEGERLDAGRRFVAPEGPTEETVAAIFREVLDLERVGAEDSFFDLGGHSLLAIQVHSRLRDAFGVDPPLRVLFERPTVAGLARGLEVFRRFAGAPSAVAPADTNGGMEEGEL